jgi:hypothetical protein
MLNVNQFRELIVKSTLNDLMLYSKDAEELMIFTCAIESLGGYYLKQLNGPALGIYQMQPETYNDLWQNYLQDSKNSRLLMMLLSNFHITNMPSEDRLIYDLRFSTAITRIFYARIKEQLPDSNNVSAMWNYYKLYYNTSKGDAEKEKTIIKYQNFIYLPQVG